MPTERLIGAVHPEIPSQYPMLHINLTGRIVSINGRTVSFPEEKKIAWEILMLLAAKPHTDISSAEIKEKEADLGLPAYISVTSIMPLRKLLEKDPKKPIIIETIKMPSRENRSAYRLNTDVIFVEDSDPDKAIIFPAQEGDEKKLSLEERRKKIIDAFFALNKNGTGFKYKSIGEIIAGAYDDKFLWETDPKERGSLISWRYRTDVATVQKQIILMLRKSASIPLGKIDSLTASLIKWLREQPVYTNLSIEDIILVMQRKISFEGITKIAERK